MEVRTMPDAASEGAELEQREERELLELLKHATLGEYDIYALLGRGGMASVFRAMELSLNRWVAIKVISASALSSATVIDRFWLEARTAASLSHPNIIPIFAVRAVEGLHFFVMKHVQGGSLDAVLKNEGPLSLAVVRTVLTQVASALAYAHRRGVIHRDIKPANIMLDEEGYAIVMDFGIAKVRDVAALTASGAMVGTPYYMSPEQFHGQPVDGRSDQYSLGCVAFELLTGQRPFKGDTVPAVLRGHLLDKAPDVRELRRDCPTSLATLVNRMLCKTPSDRFASMEMLHDQLESMPRINADVMREKITSLARTASMSNPQINEPMSPVPLSRTSAEVDIPVVQISTPSLRLASASKFIRKRPWLTAVGVAFGFLTAAIAWKQVFSAGSPAERPHSVVQKTIPASGSPASDKSIAIPLGFSASSTADSPAHVTSRPYGKVVTSESTARAPQTITSSSPAKPRSGQVQTHDPKESRSAFVASLPDAKQQDRPNVKDVLSQRPSGDTRQLLPNGVNSFASVQEDPPPPPPRALPAFRIGSRIPAAFLYVDGQQYGLLRGLRTLTHAAGTVHLQIKSDDCATWDTVFTVSEGDTAQIGFRNPNCGK